MEEVVISLDDTTITVHNMVVNVGPSQPQSDLSSVPPYVWAIIPIGLAFVVVVLGFVTFLENLNYNTKKEIKSFFKRPIVYIVNKIKRR